MLWRIGALALALALVSSCAGQSGQKTQLKQSPPGAPAGAPAATPQPVLDKAAYDAKMRALAHLDQASGSATSSAAATASATGTASASHPVQHLWPVKTVYPEPGALLPFHRVVAYYGNFYSKSMGILGELPPQEVLRRLLATSKQWEAADPTTPVIPSIDYIAVSAQGTPGADGMYRFRMPMNQVDKALSMARQVHGLLFLDIQVGHSTLQKEIPRFEKYLEMPDVELSIDPEFSMKDGRVPGTRIGTLDATDINWAANYLSRIAKAKHLPPKILVVFRFTHHMVTNYQKITPLPNVQVVVDMDGWGPPKKKIGTYKTVIYPDPVQFTGFKLFYKNDLRPPSTGMLTPAEVLKLTPAPSYIQYQ